MGLSRLFRCFSRPKYNYTSQILKLKSQRDKLEQHREVLEKRLTEFNDLCLKYVKENNRSKALFVLKRKALVSKQISMIDGFALKILEVISDAESANVQVDVTRHLQIGSKLLGEINKELKRKNFESFLESDKKNLDEIAQTMGLVQRAYEVDDLELVQELDLLTNEFNSINFDQVYVQNQNEQYNFDLDLTRLVPTTVRDTFTMTNEASVKD